MVKKYTLLILLLIPVMSVLNGQIVDSKSVLSFSAGKVFFGGSDHLFFPKGTSNPGLSLRGDYLHNILPWMKVGVEGSFVIPGTPNPVQGWITEFNIQNEKIMTMGVNCTLFLPFRESGWRNRFRFQLGIAPVFMVHSGTRDATINNEVWNYTTNQYDPTLIRMGGSSGPGLSFSPEVEYYITQRVGLKLSWNTLLTSIKSELTTEQVMMNSLNFGLSFPLSRSKQFNY